MPFKQQKDERRNPETHIKKTTGEVNKQQQKKAVKNQPAQQDRFNCPMCLRAREGAAIFSTLSDGR